MQIIWYLITLGLWLVIIYNLVHAFITHFVVWYELRLLALQDNGATKIPYLTLAKSFVIEFLCNIAKTVMTPLRFRSFRTEPAGNESAPPVLFVHGYMHNRTDWLWFTRQLQKISKIGPVFSIDLQPPLGSIAELAEHVQEKVAELRSITGAQQVILVGHSMGGLVCSYFCEYLAKPGEVARVITLGTPFKGTRLAALGAGKNVQEMSPNSPFLAELRNKIEKSTVPYFTIASKIDNLIVPWHSALLSDDLSPNNHRLILEDHGHLRLLISPYTIEQVSKWLTV